MKTKPLFMGLAAGIVIGFFLVYLVFVSANVSTAGQKVFGWVGGIAGVVSAIAFFCRTYVEYRLGIDAERKKVKFSRTYQLRADAIAEAHGKFLDLYQAVDEFQFTGGRDVNSEKWQSVALIINLTPLAWSD